MRESKDTATCANCAQVYDVGDLLPPRHFWERVEPGGVVPAGECPDEGCGALCYPNRGYVYDLEETLDRINTRKLAVELMLHRLLDVHDQHDYGGDAALWQEVYAMMGREVQDYAGLEETS